MDKILLKKLIESHSTNFFVEHGTNKITEVILTEEGIKALINEAIENNTCTWTVQNDGSYDGSCGVTWAFIDGGIEDNDTHYCPHCGGKIIQAIKEST